jgi:alpha-tubulin suppressor-like RCC1 family protein
MKSRPLLAADGFMATRRWVCLTSMSIGAWVTQSCGSKAAADVTTQPPPPQVASTVKISGAVDSLSQLESMHLIVKALTADGVTITNPTVQWKSVDERIATVDNAGVVLARKPGIARIIGQVNAAADTVSVTVRMKWLLVTTGVLGRISCGIGGDSTAYCWGDPFVTPGPANQTIPHEVSSTLRFASVSIGAGHACGLTGAGIVYCWGVNTSGQLGDATRDSSAVPVRAKLELPATQVAAGFGVTCALVASGDVYCWGSNSSGQAGHIPLNAAETIVTPTKVGGMSPIASISISGFHGCAVARSLEGYCWGMNIWATIGDGTSGNIRNATRVAGLAFRTLSAGFDATCGATVSSGVYCWGDRNQEGFPYYRTPQPLPQTIAAIGASVGNFHRCYWSLQGVWCWGDNSFGQLGAPSASFVASPIAVTGGDRFVSASAGDEGTCALSRAGDAYCWGANAAGEVGDGTRVVRVVPTRVVDPPL